MIVPQLQSENAGRARWLKIAAAAWLLLVSALAVVNSVGLSRLTEQVIRFVHRSTNLLPDNILRLFSPYVPRAIW